MVKLHEFVNTLPLWQDFLALRVFCEGERLTSMSHRRAHKEVKWPAEGSIFMVMVQWQNEEDLPPVVVQNFFCLHLLASADWKQM